MSQCVLDEPILVSFASPAHLDYAPGQHVAARGGVHVVGKAAAGYPYRLPRGIERRAQEERCLGIKAGISKKRNDRHWRPLW
jgi:hypothetical protein